MSIDIEFMEEVVVECGGHQARYIRADIHEVQIDALKAENARLDDVAYRAESYKYRIHAMQDEIAMLRELPAKMLEESAKMLSLQGPPPIHITVSQLPEWIKEKK